MTRRLWRESLRGWRACGRAISAIASGRRGRERTAGGLRAGLPGLFRPEGTNAGRAALRRRQANSGSGRPAGETVLARVQRKRFMKTVSYKKILREKLDDPETAAEYLTSCYEEGPEVVLVGLRDIAEAQGGVARAAELSKLNRESLYRLFSRDGNPRLSSLSSVLSALGLKVTFEAA